ncbi:MAG: hypothetical protein CL484_04240 [Acidobacteria bacterium]|nr:hypothetical protein [Acidobacteriota bacterium]
MGVGSAKGESACYLMAGGEIYFLLAGFRRLRQIMRGGMTDVLLGSNFGSRHVGTIRFKTGRAKIHQVRSE